ncbi:SWR1-complex protein 4 [Kwoniella mangroviensis CBS 8886]|nr:SWR1-complex protein 4 [Kwoniella mangroviensis CBS 8507]OCF63736.1 SWR1-complex protein 4 [Kwoniella mangroviensis CBS 8507]OCF78753.1 SWR1-complex protein 4 [Kwoniella mangroviensis CBS 8886]
MSSSDVRSILNLPQAGPSAPRRSTTANPAAKKPDGISRELYALIGDNAPSLAEAQASIAAVKYREKPSLKSKKVHWEWTPFSPAARQDNPVKLGHWARITDADPGVSVEYFGKFNLHGPSVMEYSQFEYDQHLSDPNWTSHETLYLFDLLKTYDLRFIIVADRYAYRGVTGTATEKKRSVEEIKDRYYTICRRLVRTRTAADPQAQQQLIHAYAFDKAREIKRKQYASELFHLTAAEIAEEEALYIEVKRMEQNERRYRADRDDLMRTIMGLDSGLVEFDQSNVEAIFGIDKNKKRKRAEEGEPAPPPPPPPKKHPKEQAAFDLAHCIYHLPPPPTNPHSSHLASKHPVHQPVHLRSTKIPPPKQNAAIRITELLNELGISAHKLVMPTRNNIETFDSLLQAAGALIDMKRQVDRVEQELRTVKAQKEGLLPIIDSRKARSESVTSTDTTTTTNKNRPSRGL